MFVLATVDVLSALCWSDIIDVHYQMLKDTCLDLSLRVMLCCPIAGL